MALFLSLWWSSRQVIEKAIAVFYICGKFVAYWTFKAVRSMKKGIQPAVNVDRTAKILSRFAYHF